MSWPHMCRTPGITDRNSTGPSAFVPFPTAFDRTGPLPLQHPDDPVATYACSNVQSQRVEPIRDHAGSALFVARYLRMAMDIPAYRYQIVPTGGDLMFYVAQEWPQTLAGQRRG